MLSPHHRLPLLQGLRRRRGVAVRGLLADHPALRLRALRGLLALPLALGLRADGGAIQVIATSELALGLLADGLARGGIAVQGLLPLAGVLGAEHLALRLPALHLALLVLRRRGLRAPGLALRTVAPGLAVLLADGLGALPGAVGHAALALLLRDQAAVLVVPGGVVADGVAAGGHHQGLLSLHGPGREPCVPFAGGGVEEGKRLTRQLDGHPHVPGGGVIHVVPLPQLGAGGRGQCNSAGDTHLSAKKKIPGRGPGVVLVPQTESCRGPLPEA
mmetsp:Transcript_27254/g.65797  ORF Transcript_27254/g.65797 Transcript_27254/m.65797 type:complete len:274 (-) Transcript_27254:7-828(-)